MDWYTFYTRYDGWAQSTLKTRIGELTDFGYNYEIIEVVCDIDEDLGLKLIKKAVSSGVRFDFDDTETLVEHGLNEAAEYIANNCGIRFTPEQSAFLKENYIYIDAPIAAKKTSAPKASSCKGCGGCARQTSSVNARSKKKRSSISPITVLKIVFLPAYLIYKLVSAILAVQVVSEQTDRVLGGSSKRTAKGRCSGDCSKCPPHYGYRYGRWYYGHGHTHGCEFGGNKGGGMRD